MVMTPKERLNSLGPPPPDKDGLPTLLWMSTGKLLELLEAQRNDALDEAVLQIRCLGCISAVTAYEQGMRQSSESIMSMERSFAGVVQRLKT